LWSNRELDWRQALVIAANLGGNVVEVGKLKKIKLLQITADERSILAFFVSLGINKVRDLQ